jgi:hypothetical protein
LLIVCVLVVASFKSLNRVSYQSPRPSVVVDVVAFQWQWRFAYPGSGVEVVGTRDRPAELVVPVGEPVHVRLTSVDVQHGFFIPRFLYKRDAIPGRINEFDLTITEPGNFQGVCGFICGLAHSDMEFLVRAVPRRVPALAGRHPGRPMTTTELPRPHASETTGGGPVDWITTVDHKKIGLLYVVSSLLFFLVGGVLAMLLRAELFAPASRCWARWPTTPPSPCTAP